jgi:hypothetical protein
MEALRWAHFSIFAIGIFVARPAIAADLGTVDPLKSTSLGGMTTIGLEASPEFFALSNSSQSAGTYADTETKLTVSHVFASNCWFVAGLFQVTGASGTDHAQDGGHG